MNIDDTKDAILSDLRISNDISEMDIPLIHRFLATESYWARGVQFEALSKSLSHSLCFAGFVGEKQVAFENITIHEGAVIRGVIFLLIMSFLKRSPEWKFQPVNKIQYPI